VGPGKTLLKKQSEVFRGELRRWALEIAIAEKSPTRLYSFPVRRRSDYSWYLKRYSSEIEKIIAFLEDTYIHIYTSIDIS
jgi:hypothetical protein